MDILPAIDLRDGKVVRLFRGDYDNMVTYSADPLEVALSFERAGAKRLHMVDLDGAKEGKPINAEVIKKVTSSTSLKVEIGGGIRDEKRIIDYLDMGVDRVILGTIAVRNFDFVAECVKKYGDKIVVGVDAKDGMVAVEGWLEKTEISAYEFCEKLKGIGVKTIIYTDISRDGTLQGTNLKAYEKLSEIKGVNFIASGGVTFLDEIDALGKIGVDGIILGKAIYDKKLDLKEAIKRTEKCAR